MDEQSHIYKRVKVSSLIPYVNNSRTHDDVQIKQIAASIKEFGITNPVLIDETGSIIAGHGRVKAMQILGINETPAIELKGLSPAQKKAYVIADNQLALNAGWDLDLLKIELEGLQENDFNIELLGFDDSFIDGLLDNEDYNLNEEDEVPEANDEIEPITKKGDVWLLGDHRVMCGDSTCIDDVKKLMQGEKADMVFTDPPYNTGMTAKSQSSQKGGTLWKGKSNKSNSTKPSHMFDDKYSDEEWKNFISDFCISYDMFSKDNIFIYICLDWRRSHELVPYLKKHWSFTNLIVWDKKVHGLGSDYKYCHEFIHVCKKGKPPLANNKDGEKEYYDIWHIQRKIGKDDDHATKKPIELVERPIRHSTKKDDLIIDLFGGSGSTLIAAEKCRRRCFTMELMPSYVDVIIKRWKNLTEKDAVLESTGETFNSLSEGK